MLNERPWIDRLGGKWTHRSRTSTKMWRKGNPSSLLEQMWMRGASVENSMEMPPETQNRTTRWSSNSTLGHISKENMVQKDTCIPMLISALFTIARTWKQPKCPSTEKWINKMLYMYIYTHTHNGILHTHNGILHTHWKEWDNAIYGNVNAPRDCHNKWSKTKTNIIW